MKYHEFTGCIAGSGFASGDCVIVGAWAVSPFGPFVDVMWVRADGRRVLLAPTDETAAYVSALYSFDDVEQVTVAGGWDGAAVAVEAGPLRVRMLSGARDARSWLFALRPRALRCARWWIAVEDRLARPFVGRVIGGADGVRAAGVAPGGQREYYGVADYRPVTDATLTIQGRNAGGIRPLPPDLGVGLSSFPTRPAVVHVTTLIEARADDAVSPAGRVT